MVQHQRKKDTEAFYVLAFLERQPGFHLVDGDRESPDFMLRDEVGDVGLEVVRVFRDTGAEGSPAMRRESLRNEALSELADSYYKAGGRPLLVEVRQLERPLEDLRQLAPQLAAHRPAQPFANSEFTTRDGSVRVYLTCLPDECADYRHWMFVNNSVGWVVRDSATQVEAAIRAKAAKLPEYRRAATRTALLVVADVMSNSGMLQWEPGRTVASYGFDFIFFYMHPKEVIRLK